MTSPLNLGDQVFDIARKKTLSVSSSALVLGRVRLLNEEDNTEEFLPLEELRRGIGANVYQVRRKGAPKFSPSDISCPTLNAALANALRATRVVVERARTNGISFHQAIQQERKEHAAALTVAQPEAAELLPPGTSFPSRPTLYRYLENMRRGLPLLRGDKNKGNRDPRYSDAVVDCITAIATKRYLEHGSRWNISAITRLANQELQDQRLLVAGAAVSKKFVHKIVHQLAPDPSAQRMDPKDRPAAKSVAKAPIRVNGLLQRVEQDALHLPWRLKTKYGESVNVWLVHAICCASSIPVGFHFVIGAPRESDGLQCMETTLFSKAALFKELGITTDIDLYGAPGQVAFDNGPEAKGTRMRNLVHFGSDPQYLKSRTPQGKPFIERLNRSLKEALQTLPGCTRFDDVDGMRDPELLGDCAMDLEEFKTWVVRWYYEVWVNTPLKRLRFARFVEPEHLGDTPAERFRNMVKRGYSYPLPPNRHTWERAKYEHHSRTLSNKTGITLEGFTFRGPRLESLAARYWNSPVTVLVDPDDFRTVFVMDGEENVELTNIFTDERTPAYSFAQAKEMAKGECPPPRDVENFWRSLYARSTRTESSTSREPKSRSERSQQTAKLARADQAAQRSRKKPPKAGPATVASAPTTAVDSLSLDDVEAYPLLDRKTGASV